MCSAYEEVWILNKKDRDKGYGMVTSFSITLKDMLNEGWHLRKNTHLCPDCKNARLKI